ncbi:MAG TPA: hypothetical protein VFS44_08835 [Gemmatimonadaceae bacterium]|nr:hypothetical protein [Gemmatimonadaceae bacterium]
MTQPHPAGPPTRRARLVATAIRLVTFASIALLVWNVDILQRHALARWAGAALGVLALASVIRAFARDRRAGREGPGSPWWIAAYGVSALALVLNGPDVLDRLPK